MRELSAVILPTYNEAKNIEELLLKIEELKLISLIIVIDDSSSDGTQEIVMKLQEEFDNILLFTRSCKMGLGTAIRDGFKILSSLKERPRYVITMDADLSHNPLDIPKLLKCALRGYDIVIGSRYVKGGRIINWPPWRRLISQLANKLARPFISLPVRDFTSGFRCYSMKYILRALPMLKSHGFEIQIETLKVAQALGAKITEVPITFVNRKAGKSKLNEKEVLRYFLTLLRCP